MIWEGFANREGFEQRAHEHGRLHSFPERILIAGSLKRISKNVGASGTGGPGGKQRGKVY